MCSIGLRHKGLAIRRESTQSSERSVTLRFKRLNVADAQPQVADPWGEQWRCHRPHPGKEAKRYQVEEIRELLERIGEQP